MFYLLWKYGADSGACFVVAGAGFVSLILEEGSFLRVIPERRLAKTGDILGEYFDDFGVNYLGW